MSVANGFHGDGSSADGKRTSGLLRWLRRRDEVPVAELQRAKRPLRFGIAFLIVLAIGVYFGFTKHVPFTHGFRLNGVFTSALNIAPGAPVREAGVNIGKVTSTRRVSDAGEVRMEISGAGLPIHRDATLKLRPRLFLEGNWFVELQPGNPPAPKLSSGATIPITQTAVPVQLDQVLAALNSNTRANLQEVLIEYGRALSAKPTHAENAEQDPEVRGLSGAEALNKAASHGPAALRGAAIVNQALGGTHERDLSTLVASVNRVTAALDVHSHALGELITNFNTFFEAFAAQSSSLRNTVAQLPPTLRTATHSFRELEAAFPAIRSFSEAITPGVEQTPATVAAFLPWIAQVRGLLSPSELGGLAKNTRESAPSIFALTNSSIPFYEQNNLFSQCLTNVLIPAGNAILADGPNTSGEGAFKEFWYSLVGQNSAGQTFTGNGPNGFRSLVSGGGETLASALPSIVSQKSTPFIESNGKPRRLFARTPLPPLGTRPRFPASEPPYKPLVPCHTQALPNFNGPLASGPADGSGG
jgi:phospholipid/cholesterol/gamma-HCH transport system substrate-binding protein